MNTSRIRFYEAMYHQGKKVPELRDFYNYFISGGKILHKRKHQHISNSTHLEGGEGGEEPLAKSNSPHSFMPSIEPDMMTELSSMSPHSSHSPQSTHPSPSSHSPQSSVSNSPQSPQSSHSPHPSHSSLGGGSTPPISPKSSSSTSSTSSTSSPKSEESEESLEEHSDKESHASHSSTRSLEEQGPKEEPCKGVNITKGGVGELQRRIDQCMEDKEHPPTTPNVSNDSNDSNDSKELDRDRIQRKIKLLEDRLAKK